MSRLAQTLPRIPSAVELYKYCKAEHRAGMLSRGVFRVGTLHDYRRTDIYGELVSDEQEGKKVIGGNISQLSAETAHLYPGLEALRQAGLINIDFSSGTRIENLSIESAVSESPNLLIFSTSVKYSAKIHEHWREAEGYDACYKITSARLFFRAVSRAIRNRIQVSWLWACGLRRQI